MNTYTHTLSHVVSFIEMCFFVCVSKNENKMSSCKWRIKANVVYIFCWHSEFFVFVWVDKVRKTKSVYFGKEMEWIGREKETYVWPIANNDANTKEYKFFSNMGVLWTVCVWLLCWINGQQKTDNFHSIVFSLQVDCGYLVHCTTISTCDHGKRILNMCLVYRYDEVCI